MVDIPEEGTVEKIVLGEVVPRDVIIEDCVPGEDIKE